MKRLTTEEYVQKCVERHGTFFDYSKVVYTVSVNPIKIICPLHGPFSVSANFHMTRGSGCLQCETDRKKAAGRWSSEEFINRAKAIHGDEYDYGLVEYINSLTNVSIICQTHGVFRQLPSNHINNECGCPHCSSDSQAIARRHSLEEFCRRAAIIHGDMYDYSLVEPVGWNRIVKIICPAHGVFEQSPNNHTRGSICPSCNGRRSKIANHWLDHLEVPVREYRIKAPGRKRYIYFDGYSPSINTAYQFHGTYWHGHPDFFPDRDAIHPKAKKSFGYLYDKTLETDSLIRAAGYTLVTMWEHEWRPNVLPIRWRE